MFSTILKKNIAIILGRLFSAQPLSYTHLFQKYQELNFPGRRVEMPPAGPRLGCGVGQVELDMPVGDTSIRLKVPPLQ